MTWEMAVVIAVLKFMGLGLLLERARPMVYFYWHC